MRLRWPLLLIVALALPLQATTVKRLDLEGLVSIAQTIVVGEVKKSETYWSPDGRLILTRHTIEVGETLKGSTAETVEITTIGGTIGDRTLYVAGMPAFAPGEETIVFTETIGAYRTVVGLGQGKFSVTDGGVTNDLSNLEFPDKRPGRKTRMRLGPFKDEIRRRLGSRNKR